MMNTVLKTKKNEYSLGKLQMAYFAAESNKYSEDQEFCMYCWKPVTTRETKCECCGVSNQEVLEDGFFNIENETELIK